MYVYIHVGKGTDKSPIPTKPALARGASSKKKVPPIAMHRDHDDMDRDFLEDDGQEEVNITKPC